MLLHNATASVVSWLNLILPRVSETWWEDCVISSLSFSQREIAKNNNLSSLADFDLAALLKIANKSWYDMKIVENLCSSDRQIIVKMIGVRNNWANCDTTLPGKDIIVDDLNVLKSFFNFLKSDSSIIVEIEQLIEYVEKPGNLIFKEETLENEIHPSSSCVHSEIKENSIVCITGSPEKKGIVHRITPLGTIAKYDVFIDGCIQPFYSGQIALIDEPAEYNWVNVDEVSSYLTAYQINNPSSHNLYSLNSARIDFVPYQFRPALKMIRADEPRILIADSVGVGKTIEAGLIIKELEARNEIEKVLIICPRPLVAERKWEIEMKRFDEEFIPVDGNTLRQIISDTDRDGEWPSRFNKIIIPYSILDSRVFLGDSHKRLKTFGLKELDPEPHFDLVIIDEAHHIRNGSDTKEKAFAYKCAKYFCDHSNAVVMLTATPLQTGDSDLFTLLNILRPDIIIDENTFSMMSRPNAHISKAIRILRSAEEGWEEKAISELLKIRKTQWGENVISEDPMYDDILLRLENNIITREERVKLIADIESLHSFSTLINRTRRKDIQDFCIRRSHTISTQFTEYQKELHNELLSFERMALASIHNQSSVEFMISTVKRQAASCIFGLAPYIRDFLDRRIGQLLHEEGVTTFNDDNMNSDVMSSITSRIIELADSLPNEDPKFEETLKIIKAKQTESNNKIMIFSTFRHTLSYLKNKLSEEGLRVEQVDGSVKDEQRYELKERFELPKDDINSIDILLFSEVGSEGLDYQFCDMMINYDLPWNPMKIEQRIGRIDRRGQKSEVVNIYNIITEDTVDADIYYRCLMRIGIFESSIGECEEILGDIANGIETIVYSSTLTNEERKKKLEQIADNEVRKIQEISRLEDEERELFGFDLTEFMTSQAIRKAENPWLSQSNLQKMIEQYLKEKIGEGTYIYGESDLKNLRLSSSSRSILKEDLRKLTGSKNSMQKSWDNYLTGKKPNHSITFDSETASKNRKCFFITSVHPLAKQAAEHFSHKDTVYLQLKHHTNAVLPGQYIFSIYAWRYVGFNSYTQLIAFCENDELANELTDIIETSNQSYMGAKGIFNWSVLEEEHARRWISASREHKRKVQSTIKFKLESLANSHNNKVRNLEQRINDASDESIRRMYKSSLESENEKYATKSAEISAMLQKADIYTNLLINGVIIVEQEE